MEVGGFGRLGGGGRSLAKPVFIGFYQAEIQGKTEK